MNLVPVMGHVLSTHGSLPFTYQAQEFAKSPGGIQESASLSSSFLDSLYSLNLADMV